MKYRSPTRPLPTSSLGEVTQMALAFMEKSSLREVSVFGMEFRTVGRASEGPHVGLRGREVPQVIFPHVVAGMQWGLRPALVCVVLWPVSSGLEFGSEVSSPLCSLSPDQPSSPTRKPCRLDLGQ